MPAEPLKELKVFSRTLEKPKKALLKDAMNNHCVQTNNVVPYYSLIDTLKPFRKKYNKFTF